LQELSEFEEEARREMDRMQEEHDLELEKLDRQVKLEISTKDEDIDVLRDAVHTEKVKSKKLHKLLMNATAEVEGPA
jgi:hypothetical protein